jgi:hypothetical protein
MRRLLVLSFSLLGCASSGGGGTAAPSPAALDRVVLTDERGRVYRSAANTASAAEQTVPGTVQQAVQALVGTYEGLGLSVSTIDWTNGIVGVRMPTAPRRIGGQSIARYVDCGTNHLGEQRANSYAVTLNVQSSVVPAAAGEVQVTTLASATARQQGVSSDPLNCPTLGVLEKRVNALAAERLASVK